MIRTPGPVHDVELLFRKVPDADVVGEHDGTDRLRRLCLWTVPSPILETMRHPRFGDPIPSWRSGNSCWWLARAAAHQRTPSHPMHNHGLLDDNPRDGPGYGERGSRPSMSNCDILLWYRFPLDDTSARPNRLRRSRSRTPPGCTKPSARGGGDDSGIPGRKCGTRSSATGFRPGWVVFDQFSPLYRCAQPWCYRLIVWRGTWRRRRTDGGRCR